MSDDIIRIRLFEALRSYVVATRLLQRTYELSQDDALARETGVLLDAACKRLGAVAKLVPDRVRHIEQARIRNAQQCNMPQPFICPVCDGPLRDTSACEINSCTCDACGYMDAEAGGILI